MRETGRGTEGDKERVVVCVCDSVKVSHSHDINLHQCSHIIIEVFPFYS